MAQTTFNAVARRLLQLKPKAWSILVVSQELSTILSKIWFQHAAIIKEKAGKFISCQPYTILSFPLSQNL